MIYFFLSFYLPFAKKEVRTDFCNVIHCCPTKSLQDTALKISFNERLQTIVNDIVEVVVPKEILAC